MAVLLKLLRLSVRLDKVGWLVNRISGINQGHCPRPALPRCTAAEWSFGLRQCSTKHVTGVGEPSNTEESIQDQFGTLGGTFQTDYDKYEHLEDEDDYKMKHKIRRKYLHKDLKKGLYYHDLILSKGKEGKVEEAVCILEDLLLKKRLLPKKQTFSAVIKLVVYDRQLDKAFELYEQMKELKYTPPKEVYVTLFHGCYMAFDKKEALKKAMELKECLKDESISAVMFGSMIKSFGTLVNMKKALSIADETVKENKSFDHKTIFCHLLLAARCDKRHGFYYAIQIWRYMELESIEIDIYMVGLLLQILDECQIGGDDEIQKLILSLPTREMAIKKLEVVGWFSLLALPLGEFKAVVSNIQQIKAASNPQEELPLSDKPLQAAAEQGTQVRGKQQEGKQLLADYTSEQAHSSNESATFSEERNIFLMKIDDEKLGWSLQSILEPGVQLTAESTRKDLSKLERFKLIGGFQGLMRIMKKHNLQPNNILVTKILTLIDSDDVLEDRFFKILEEIKFKPDTTVFNAWIRKRSQHNKTREAKDILKVMKRLEVIPDIKTYGCLAICCRCPNQGFGLINAIQEASMMPNSKILGILVKKSFLDLRYKASLLKWMEKNDITPDIETVQKVENVLLRARKIVDDLNTTDNKTQDNINPIIASLPVTLPEFEEFYDGWLKRVKINKKK